VEKTRAINTMENFWKLLKSVAPLPGII